MTDFQFKDNYSFYDLVDIVRRLRQPDGCPWDREQDHKSIRKNFIEETYEVCEAIDNNDIALLKEELGDVLLQVVFHSQMEAEVGSFDIDDVANDICQKLIIRHPHIFSEAKADNVDQVLDNWDKIKMETKHQQSTSEAINSICKALPALMYAQKVQKKAAKVGFDFETTMQALDKVYEEANEIKDAVEQNDTENAIEELGDLLFATVNVARFIGADSEEALMNASKKFAQRFSLVEKAVLESGKRMSDLTLSELDSLWDEVKIKMS